MTLESHNRTQKQCQQGRTAQVGRDADGNPVGAAVFLSADELATLGVDPVYADEFVYRIEGGELRVAEFGGGEGGA